MVESARQCRVQRFNPLSRKMPHAAEQLSPRASTTEPALLSSRATNAEALELQSPCSTTREATAMRSLYAATREWSLLAATRESPRTATKTHHSQKEINLKKEKTSVKGLPWGSSGNTCPYNARDAGSVPGLGGSLMLRSS